MVRLDLQIVRLQEQESDTNHVHSGIAGRLSEGYRGIHLLRRETGDEVEFVTIMWFDSIEAVKAFAGEDYEAEVVPLKARQLLSRSSGRSAHYGVLVEPS